MELVQPQLQNIVGNYQAAQANQDASKLSRIQMAAAQQEMQAKQYNQGVLRAASAGNPEAMKILSAVNPTAAKGLREEQDYRAVEGAKILDGYFSLPRNLRNQENWNKAKTEFKTRTGQDPQVPQNVSDEQEAYAKSLLTKLKGREQELKEEKAFMDTKTDLSVQETGAGLMTFDKKTGEFKPATVNGKKLPVYVKPPTSVVNVNNGEQPAFRKKLEETYGTKTAERLDKINTDADNAAQTKQWLAVQNEALANLPDTGVLDGPKIYLGNLANQLGIEVDMTKVSNLEQLKAAGNTITIPLVKQLGYNPTDADARLIGSTIANIGKSKATNLQLNDLIDQAADKQIAKAAIADSLREQKREAELTQELRKYDLANPIKLRDPRSLTKKNLPIPTDATIDATAKKYGISRDQVIAKLKEKGAI